MRLSAVPKDVSRHNARNSSHATANVGTLLDSHCARDDSGLECRVQFFELCFDRAELDLVAAQESREQGDSHRPSLLYNRFCAGADAKWRASELRSRFDDRVELCSIISKPSLRSLLLRRSSLTAWLSVISAHAPHEFRTPKVKSTFWGSVRAAVAFALAAADAAALLGDFNARLGSLGSQALGTHDKEVEIRNGAMFRHTFEGSKLVAPQFFPRELHRAMAPIIASTPPASLVICTTLCLSHTLSRTKCALREMVVCCCASSF